MPVVAKVMNAHVVVLSFRSIHSCWKQQQGYHRKSLGRQIFSHVSVKRSNNFLPSYITGVDEGSTKVHSLDRRIPLGHRCPHHFHRLCSRNTLMISVHQERSRTSYVAFVGGINEDYGFVCVLL